MSGKKSKRVNLIAGKLNNHFIAPFLIEDRIDSDIFNMWLKDHLLPSIPANSLVIMDNATFHKTKNTSDIFQNSSFILEYLPRYSPDLNPIEKVFGFLKKRFKFAKLGMSLDDIINTYCFDSV